MGDLLGGSSESTMQIPAWLEQPARRNIGRAEEISQIGYMPNFGPQVAAFTGQQIQGMKNTNKMANAYGMGGGGGLDIPKAKEFAGGVRGYSSMPMFREMRNKFAQARPGQMEAYRAQFLNPWTGAAPTSQFAGMPTQEVQDGGLIGNAGEQVDLDTGSPWGAGGGSVDGGGFGPEAGGYGAGPTGGYGGGYGGAGYGLW